MSLLSSLSKATPGSAVTCPAPAESAYSSVFSNQSRAFCRRFLSGWLIARYRQRFGFSDLSDIASLPLILVLFSIASLVVTPVALAIQRHFEHEADRFGLEITRDNYAAATAFVTLQQENLGVPRPGPIYTWWRASHPSLGDRIDFSNEYRPWESNQPLVYESYFKTR